MAPSKNNEEWDPQPGFPTDPEFYRRALHFLPSPLVVVDADGQVVFVNNAMLALGGWQLDDELEYNILEYVHPEDLDLLAEAFADIVENPSARLLGGNPWAEIYFRITAADGTIIPIELVGNGGLMDPAVGGIIYEVRPARTRNLLGRVLDGLSQGASMHHLLSLVSEMIASPPLDLEAALLQSAADGSFIVAASTAPVLTEVIRGDVEGLPWSSSAREPEFVDIQLLPETLSGPMRAAGYRDLWHVAVESPLTANTLRIIAVSRTHHVPATGPKNRLIRARELAAAVLLRSQADVLLDYAAGHDRLTDLPNRAAFYQLAEAVNPLIERGALHLDLDGLKRVNTGLGQATGDAVLQIVADRLRATCSPDEVIGRIGDDEFSILVSEAPADISLATRSLELAQAILAAVRDPIVVAGRPLHLTTSIGVAVAGSGVSNDHLMTWADAAMHDAKHAGGGRICRYGVNFG